MCRPHLEDAAVLAGDRARIASLVRTVDECIGRISELVAAVKEYSYMDRAAVQDVNVQDGIEKTMVMLGAKIQSGLEVVRDYSEQLPVIRTNGAELNQVWTNLIDNAIDAMNGQGSSDDPDAAR